MKACPSAAPSSSPLGAGDAEMDDAFVLAFEPPATPSPSPRGLRRRRRRPSTSARGPQTDVETEQFAMSRGRRSWRRHVIHCRSAAATSAARGSSVPTTSPTSLPSQSLLSAGSSSRPAAASRLLGPRLPLILQQAATRGCFLGKPIVKNIQIPGRVQA